MARQSPTNPRFRCNGCKNYYTAPNPKVHYQCASHGYLCNKHLVNKIGNPLKISGGGRLKIPTYHKGKCKEAIKGSHLSKHGTVPNHPSRFGYVKNADIANVLKKEVCLKKPVKYNWHKDVGRWIEEGREKEEKAKAKPKAKSKTKPDYAKEIKVLVDLLEDDTLTKEVFIKKIREKLK